MIVFHAGPVLKQQRAESAIAGNTAAALCSNAVTDCDVVAVRREPAPLLLQLISKNPAWI